MRKPPGPLRPAVTAIVVLSDTHRDAGTGLTGRAREAAADAGAVVHAGDFTTADALDAFRSLDARLHAVHGNRDAPAVTERLPGALTTTLGGVTVAVTHTASGGEQALSLFGRERGAALVVSGHTHRPSVGGVAPVVLNPGSHTSPRGGPATHAELEATADGLAGAIRTADGDVVSRVEVAAP